MTRPESPNWQNQESIPFGCKKCLSFEVRWIWRSNPCSETTLGGLLTTLSLSVQIKKNGPSAQVTVMVQWCNSCLQKSFKKPSTILTACQGLDECWSLCVKTTSGSVALQASLIQSVCGSGPEVKAISCLTFFPVFLSHLLWCFLKGYDLYPWPRNVDGQVTKGLTQTKEAWDSTQTIAQRNQRPLLYPLNRWQNPHTQQEGRDVKNRACSKSQTGSCFFSLGEILLIMSMKMVSYYKLREISPEAAQHQIECEKCL